MRSISIRGQTPRQWAQRRSGSFPSLPNSQAAISRRGRKREAQAFPRRTLVLAFARSRHLRPVCLRPEGGRNLQDHYREEDGRKHLKNSTQRSALSGQRLYSVEKAGRMSGLLFARCGLFAARCGKLVSTADTWLLADR